MIWLGKYMYQFDTSWVEKNPNRKFPIISSRWASFNISEAKWVFGDLPVPHPKQQFCYSAREVDQSTE